MTKPLQCLHYSIFNDKDKELLEKRFKIKDDTHCPYKLQLTKYHVGECNNPAVKSVGSDFNGYIRIEIRRNFKCCYKVQSDFKTDKKAALERVLMRFKEELLDQ